VAGGVSIGSAEEPAVHTFTVQVVNKTCFDIELIDSSRLVRRNSERTVTLHRYEGEVDDGYSLTYRVNLLDGVYMPIKRDEHVMVKPGQKTLLVETAGFTSNESFIIVKNESVHTVRIRNSEGYLVNLENAVPRRRYGSANIAAGGSALFDAIPREAAFSIESDNYKTFPFPLTVFKPGCRYAFIFDGNTVELDDTRPLYAIGLPLNAAVVFDGGLPESEWEQVIQALDEALAANNTPLRVPPDSGVLSEEDAEDVNYVFSLTLTMGRQAAAPMLKREFSTGDVTLTLFLNGRALAEAKTRITEFDEHNVYRALRRFIREEKQFYRNITEKLRRF
jgi:hypothetical protein